MASDLRNAMIRAFGEAYERNKQENSLIKVSSAAVDLITETVVSKIQQLNPEAGLMIEIGGQELVFDVSHIVTGIDASSEAEAIKPLSQRLIDAVWSTSDFLTHVPGS